MISSLHQTRQCNLSWRSAPPHRRGAAAPTSSIFLKSHRKPSTIAVSNSTGRELWGYPDTCVRTIELESFRLMHRASFSHRNLRTYVVVVYVPGSTRCAAVEHEVERMASGLSHEKRVVVGKLNALGSKEAFTFCTSMMEAKQYPTVFMYPEGTPGCMRFTGTELTAEGLLSALNGCYKQVLQNRQPLKLVGAPAGTAAAPALAEADVQRQRQNTGNGDGRAAPRQNVSVVEELKIDLAYWSSGKVAFWGFIAIFSVGASVWETWGEDWWDQWSLKERQRQRKLGKDFDEEVNAEDILRFKLMGPPPQSVVDVEEDEDGDGDEEQAAEQEGAASRGDPGGADLGRGNTRRGFPGR